MSRSLRDSCERRFRFDPGAFVWCGEGDDPGKRTLGAIIRFDGERPLRFDPAPAFRSGSRRVFGQILGRSAEEQHTLAVRGALR